MDTLFISEIKKTLTSDVEFEFELDFQGQVDYLQSVDTDQFLEYEQVLLFLVDKGLIPINEKTEGVVTIKMGIVYLDYKTCTRIGGDWNDDMWEHSTSEHLVLNLLGE